MVSLAVLKIKDKENPATFYLYPIQSLHTSYTTNNRKYHHVVMVLCCLLSSPTQLSNMEFLDNSRIQSKYWRVSQREKKKAFFCVCLSVWKLWGKVASEIQVCLFQLWVNTYIHLKVEENLKQLLFLICTCSSNKHVPCLPCSLYFFKGIRVLPFCLYLLTIYKIIQLKHKFLRNKIVLLSLYTAPSTGLPETTVTY